MNQIVNVNRSWGIGKDGDLLCHIPEDMRFFKEMTLGKTVIMGRKTLDSFPGGKPLKGRRNIVLTRSLDKVLEHKLMQAGEAVSSLSKSMPAASLIPASDEASESGAPDTGGPSDTELIYVDSIDKLFSLLPEDTSDVFVIGGESIYSLLLPYCDTFYITKNDCKKEADTFYPDLDDEASLSLVYESAEKQHNDISYRFCTYKRSPI